MRSVYFALGFLAALSAAGRSATLYVPDDYPGIQDAIDASSNGDTIIVRPGTYVENIDYLGKAITIRSELGPGGTVIDGNRDDSVVVFMTAEGPDSMLDGFTITNGYWDASIIGDGAGIACYETSPTIRNNVITGNEGQYGGGIYCYGGAPSIEANSITGNEGGGIGCAGAAPLIEANTIDGNLADFGGGINCWGGSSPVILRNTITHNAAKDYPGGLYTFGGGIAVMDGDAEINGNLVAWNTSEKQSGGIHLRNASGVIANNRIIANSAFSTGGLSAYGQSAPLIINNTFHGNLGTWSGDLLSADFAAPRVVNSIFWNKLGEPGKRIMIGEPCGLPASLEVSCSDIKEGKDGIVVNYGCTLIWGPGNIDQDPLFVEPAMDDFHLTHPSPCRDAGDSLAPGLPSIDFEGDPRVAHGAVDMGADEFHTHLYYTGDAAPGQSIKLKFVGLPGTAPVGLFLGSGLLDPPLPSMWGDWYLLFPIIGPIDPGAIPYPDGVLVLTGSLPGSPPGPYSIPMQAIIGADLTNVCVMHVQ